MKKDWTDLQKNYAGQWVALAADETTVISASTSLQDVCAEAREKTGNTPQVSFVPERETTFVGALGL